MYVCAVYFPPNQVKKAENDLLAHIEAVSEGIVLNQQVDPLILLGGDFNQLPDSSILSLGFVNAVNDATHKGHRLDRLYSSQPVYRNVRVVCSNISKTEHKAIVARGDRGKIEDIHKKRESVYFRLRTPARNARFLATMAGIVWPNFREAVDVQAAFDHFYERLNELMDSHFPQQRVMLTSRDPAYMTPYIKAMLRRKNRLMRQGRTEQANALANRIGNAILRVSTRQLSDQNAKGISMRSLWSSVNRLTKKRVESGKCRGIDAEMLNKHYGAVSTDSSYEPPELKQTCNSLGDWPGEYLVFRNLDSLRSTSAGPDGVPFWFLKLGAPYLAKPLSDLYCLSLSRSIVPIQWKSAIIVPVAKHPSPEGPSDFRPISVTSLLSRMLERMITRHYLYPIISNPSSGIYPLLEDQYAFRPTGSTTAALVAIHQKVVENLETEPYVRLISVDFSKAFDTVRHSTLFRKLALLPIPDHLYNWLVQFFDGRTHATCYEGVTSSPITINSSIVQGSGLGPVLFDINSSDLHPQNDVNSMVKYADDAHLVVPARSDTTAVLELEHIKEWARENNLALNQAKCKEMVIRKSNRIVGSHILGTPGLTRVKEMKVLGVILNETMSMSDHVEQMVVKGSQTLYALRVLQTHGLRGSALHLVSSSLLESRMSYASPAWQGFALQQDKARLQKVLDRAGRWGLDGGKKIKTVEEMFTKADGDLFRKVVGNPGHVLHALLPPPKAHEHALRKRKHSLQMPRYSTQMKSNFIPRMLYKDAY